MARISVKFGFLLDISGGFNGVGVRPKSVKNRAP
jgi:hypothetical protein